MDSKHAWQDVMHVSEAAMRTNPKGSPTQRPMAKQLNLWACESLVCTAHKHGNKVFLEAAA